MQSMSVVIGAIIALLVLAVALFITMNSSGTINAGFSSCAFNGGNCSKGTSCPDSTYEVLENECPSQKDANGKVTQEYTCCKPTYLTKSIK